MSPAPLEIHLARNYLSSWRKVHKTTHGAGNIWVKMRHINYRRLPRFMQPSLRPVTLYCVGAGLQELFNYAISPPCFAHTHADHRVIASRVCSPAKKKKHFQVDFAFRVRAQTRRPTAPHPISWVLHLICWWLRQPTTVNNVHTYDTKLLLTSSDARMESAAVATDVMGSKFSNSRPLSYMRSAV